MPYKIPEDWNDSDYLSNNPDVANAVVNGQFENGYMHYMVHGCLEKRTGGWKVIDDNKLTRGCLDPWNYIEITPDFGIKPCCKIGQFLTLKQNDSIAAVRNAREFALLRQQLLKGVLNKNCEKCHIRPMVSARELKKMVGRTGDSALISQPLKHLRIELTTRCNLRCVYCAASQPGYSGKDLETSNFEKILSLVKDSEQNLEIHINGHGETTFHPDWLLLVKPLLDLGKKISIITNLSKPLTDEEANILAKFYGIEVSLDTVDPELLPKLRRKVQLGTIVDNLNKIKSYVRWPSKPIFSISCGVYDKSIDGIPDLCNFSVENKIHSITFWQLVKYADVQNEINVYPIESLCKEKITSAILIMDLSFRFLKSKRIKVQIAGDFVNNWRRLLNRNV